MKSNSNTSERATRLLAEIDQKIAEIKAANAAKTNRPKPKPATRAAINKANAQSSTGPKTDEGKATAAKNSLRHGFFANVEKLLPQDAPTYINTLASLRAGLHPDGPVEDLFARQLVLSCVSTLVY